ncbi:hypothetical protein NDU88_003364 [Pleurodeles waltl]|uniref:Uncharacterized protein n=1 Tax=Pleurodeles waltl TaxID=8319 RepID=A0AAV7MAU5_PLEWA|nr:hypothetical protein NDU88_003364 [Pleurodeles waltl]
MGHRATQDGSLLPDWYRWGTAWPEPEDAPLGNPDIQIPVAEKSGARPWRGEEDVETQEERDDAGDPKERTDVGREEKAELENRVRGERREEKPHAEWSYREQLPRKCGPEEEKRNPGTPRDRHVSGRAWLQEVQSCFHNRINACLWKEEGERGKKGGEGGGRKGRDKGE